MSFPINPNLVWDYEIPTEDKRTEAFNRWYLARVLTRGNSEDIKGIGIERIYHYFLQLNLPQNIRVFWEWYFNQPEIRARYESVEHISA